MDWQPVWQGAIGVGFGSVVTGMIAAARFNANWAVARKDLDRLDKGLERHLMSDSPHKSCPAEEARTEALNDRLGGIEQSIGALSIRIDRVLELRRNGGGRSEEK